MGGVVRESVRGRGAVSKGGIVRIKERSKSGGARDHCTATGLRRRGRTDVAAALSCMDATVGARARGLRTRGKFGWGQRR